MRKKFTKNSLEATWTRNDFSPQLNQAHADERLKIMLKTNSDETENN